MRVSEGRLRRRGKKELGLEKGEEDFWPGKERLRPSGLIKIGNLTPQRM